MIARRLIALAMLAGLTPVAAQAQDLAAMAETSEALADQFERALVAGDYRTLPLAEDFAYFENGARLDPWDGMWRTLTALEGAIDHPDLDYRVELVQGFSVVRVIEFEENTVHGVLAYRMQRNDQGQITRVDVLPIREEFGGDRGGTLTLLQPMLAQTMDGAEVGDESAAFRGSIWIGGGPQAQNGPISRYLGLAAASGQPLTFADDCVRFDNGQQVTGLADAPLLDPAQPQFRPNALSCREQFESGFYSNLTPGNVLEYRGFAGGPALAFARLDQAGTVSSFAAPGVGQVAYPGPRGAVQGANTGEQFDGRILTNMISPMSINGVWLFAFDETGAVSRIDAFYRGAPLGWDAVPD